MSETNHQVELNAPVNEMPAYVPPVVTTYTDEQLLDALGPAQAQRYPG